jgi:hypothetical protein
MTRQHLGLAVDEIVAEAFSRNMQAHIQEGITQNQSQLKFSFFTSHY